MFHNVKPGRLHDIGQYQKGISYLICSSIDRGMLCAIMIKGITEADLIAHGRFGDLKETVEKEKVKTMV